jgi:hypothetical protein
MRNIGKFKVSCTFIEEAERGDGANLFKDMIVIDIRRDFTTNNLEYLAYHPDFKPIAEGSLIPEYTALFSFDSTYPKWKML